MDRARPDHDEQARVAPVEDRLERAPPSTAVRPARPAARAPSPRRARASRRGRLRSGSRSAAWDGDPPGWSRDPRTASRMGMHRGGRHRSPAPLARAVPRAGRAAAFGEETGRAARRDTRQRFDPDQADANLPCEARRSPTRMVHALSPLEEPLNAPTSRPEITHRARAPRSQRPSRPSRSPPAAEEDHPTARPVRVSAHGPARRRRSAPMVPASGRRPRPPPSRGQQARVDAARPLDGERRGSGPRQARRRPSAGGSTSRCARGRGGRRSSPT